MVIEQTTATPDALAARTELEQLYIESPLLTGEKMFNLGLYTRASLLVKFLVMDDLYKRILNVPGALVEFGCWYGQNLVLLENLRAIHEPFNKMRKIIGFDSFDGYEDGTYAAGGEYVPKLLNLLRVHERMNAFGHMSNNHALIVGDVTKTAREYFRGHHRYVTNESGVVTALDNADGHRGYVALALFDLGNSVPTAAAMGCLRERLTTGSVFLLDSEHETQAFEHIAWTKPYRMEKCAMYPEKTIVTFS